MIFLARLLVQPRTCVTGSAIRIISVINVGRQQVIPVCVCGAVYLPRPLFKELQIFKLYADYWLPQSEDPSATLRAAEIKYALRNNAVQDQVTEVTLVTQQMQAAVAFVNDLNPAVAGKIAIVTSEKRPTFQQFFELANKNTNATAIHVLINNDIVLTKSFSKLSTTLGAHDFLCITRQIPVVNDHNHTWVLEPYKEYSQDVWCWQGLNRITAADFEMGQIRCDQCVAYRAEAAGYSVRNPALTLHARHRHTSNYRTYNKAGMLTLPGKLTVPTT